LRGKYYTLETNLIHPDNFKKIMEDFKETCLDLFYQGMESAIKEQGVPGFRPTAKKRISDHIHSLH
jgi:hypothetical protein